MLLATGLTSGHGGTPKPKTLSLGPHQVVLLLLGLLLLVAVPVLKGHTKVQDILLTFYQIFLSYRTLKAIVGEPSVPFLYRAGHKFQDIHGEEFLASRGSTSTPVEMGRQDDVNRFEPLRAKNNRASTSQGSAGPTHVGGSISASQHRFNMEKETGVAPSPIDVFRRTHQRNDQSWENKRSAELMEKFSEEMNQRTQSAAASGDPTPNQLECDVAGFKRQALEHIRTEKNQMEDRLAITQGQLSVTQERLANTEGQLSKTEDQLAITQGRLTITEDELAKTKEKVDDLDACLQEVRVFMKNHSVISAQRVSLVEQKDHGDDVGTDDDETEPPDDLVL